MRRSVPALIAIALVAGAALTGCSASHEASAACTVKSGGGSESIRATGAFGKDPQAKVPSPLNVTTAQSTTLIQGNGKVVGTGGVANVALTLFDGTSGQQGGDTAANYVPVTSAALGAGLADAIGCARVGSRLAVVIPPKQAATVFNAPTGDSVAAIVDITSAVPSRATGRPRPATPGFPTVILAPNGQPGIVIGSHSEPTKVQSAVLRQGDGATAKKTDTLIVQTQTVSWADPTTASGSWEQGSATSQTLSDGSAVSSQLIGKKIGSQVIVLVPKSKSSDGQSEATVIDILGRVPASAVAGQQ